VGVAVSTPIISQLATGLNIVAAAGAPFTVRFPMTLPEGVALTDARFWTYDPDVEEASLFIDVEVPEVAASWTEEQTATFPLRAGEYVLMIAIDGAPLAPLVSGRLSWVPVTYAGASTTTTQPLAVYIGDIVVEVAATFAGPQGPPFDGVTGVGIDTIEAITQAAYDLLDPPDPSTLYVIT